MRFESGKVKEFFDVQWGDTNKTKASYVPEGYLAYSASGPDGFLDSYDYDREGVVLSAIGANCGVTYFAEGKWSCIKNTIRILPKEGLSDAAYFYYLSKSPNFWPKRGSAQPFISQTDIRELEVRLPPLEIQQSIGKVLRQLDEKITTNSDMSSYLEQIAQTIFKSWFIDFDPVHAKSLGEQPEGIDAETAALFPDSLEESKLGLIPVGWAAESLGKHLAPKKGKVITKATTNPGVVPVVAGGLEPAYFHDTHNVRGPAVTISASGANAGFVRLYSEDIWASDCTYISRDETESVFYWYVFLKLRQEEIWHMQQGGAQPHIYSSDLQRLEAAFPGDSRLIMKFETIARPLFEMVAAKNVESKALSQLRDVLLPRLISGELEIPEELLVD